MASVAVEEKINMMICFKTTNFYKEGMKLERCGHLQGRAGPTKTCSRIQHQHSLNQMLKYCCQQMGDKE